MNLRHISEFIVLITIALVSLIFLYTLFRCKSEKKNYFLICLIAILVQMTGHLLELMSTSTDEAFTAVRVFYLGIGLLTPSMLFFVSEYCEAAFPRVLKYLLTALAIVFVVGAWTTDTTGLLYSSYYYDAAVSDYIVYQPGRLLLLFRLYPAVHVIAALIILIRRMRSSTGDRKKVLIILMLSVLLPFCSEIGYCILVAANSYAPALYLTPYALSVMSVLLCFGVVKYDMFGTAPLAAIAAMDTISEAVILLDEKLLFVSANAAAHALLPWLRYIKAGEAVHRSAYWPAKLSREVFTGEKYLTGFSLLHSDDRYYHASVHPFETEFSRKKYWSVPVQDVTETENFVRRLEEAAYTDTLTGLYNRRHCAEIATPFIERAKRMNLPYYVMIADLDFFKEINDQYGHLAGDAVLRNTASIMKTAVRSYDILARWGGEEFIFLITDTEASSVVALAERIRRNVEASECEYQNKKLRITISFGIARNDGDDEITELVLRADEALYRSKQNGRNMVTMWGP